MRNGVIGINGFGRIGRGVLRAANERKKSGEDLGLDFAVINDITDAKTLAHLLKYDSVHGPYNGNVWAGSNSISVDEKEILITSQKSPEEILWTGSGVDIVLESTGRFDDKENASKHLGGTVGKVVVSAPVNGVYTMVYGINQEVYNPDEHHVISNASCTTNALAPVAYVLHKEFKIESGVMTTVHSYTNDQKLLDSPHKDLRRARAAGISMIITKTGAAEAIGKVIPELEGKLTGIAVRVPTPNVSLIDLTAYLEKDASASYINAALKKASETYLQGILGYSGEPLVSVDYNGDTRSAIVDGPSTITIGRMAKVLAWYDNERAYSHRLVDVLKYVWQRRKEV